ncbi:flavodoxin family protein [Actinomyces oris]|uniref:flavodoxin family protein n=1 Tax=Actinomyces oris TaxID=544580 RepID=UPI002852B75C|nr:flavodoxin domain-containing protein [Actinomyces oris]
MTRALIVVESYFGNTRAIAEAVAAGLIAGGVEAQVVDVAQAPGALPSDLDLLVLGAPTHNRGLPTVATRSKARAQAGSGATSPGISEWLGDAEVPAALSVAAFDTVISNGWLSGSAAKAIAKALRRRQGRRTVSVRSFVVTASKGPLAAGQETDARSWGRELADSASSR